ncbi:hypothetical protein AJ79_06618 [Helicocarpus griseus UAMH5409]|uniref:Uncharacterized protein n=1 Tax=Helicocarpus griseus UAMH5409 TaxID=1447875 RepID=A0A2B7X353_9EURO|nr:hypothetical protein AJ79_06618 [Helicocarpus griseus UAMH5409]
MDPSTEVADGYLDDVCSVFDRHNHPIVLVEQCATVWMGCPGNSTDYDFLVRDSQLDAILATLIESGEWKQIEQDLSSRSEDANVTQVPRLRRLVREPVYISLWPEKIYFLSVDDPKIQVPDVTCLDRALIEEHFDPKLGYPLTKSDLEARKTRILPKQLARRENTSPVFIPTIPRMINALLDQDRQRNDQTRDFNLKSPANRPAEHISNIMRSLHLERPDQKEKFLPYISDHNLSSMEARLAGFKRRPTIVLDNLTGLPKPRPQNLSPS